MVESERSYDTGTTQPPTRVLRGGAPAARRRLIAPKIIICSALYCQGVNLKGIRLEAGRIDS